MEEEVEMECVAIRLMSRGEDRIEMTGLSGPLLLVRLSEFL